MVRVTSLALKNFKSVGATKQQIDLAPITLLFGPNSAGKSSLLQSLIYLREIVCNRNLNPDHTELGGGSLDLGGFKNLVHGRDLDSSIEISVDMALDVNDLPMFLSHYEEAMLYEHGLPSVSDFFEEVESAQVSISLKWSEGLQRVVVDSFTSSLDGKEIAHINASLDGRRAIVERLELSSEGFNQPFGGLPGEASFADTVMDLIGGSVFQSADTPFSDERMLSDESIGDLEKRLDTLDLPPKQLLQQLKKELSYRTSRRAHDLNAQIETLLANHPDDKSIQLVYLRNQKDALPNESVGLEFDSDVWNITLDESLSPDSFSDQLDERRMLQELVKAGINAAVCGPLQCLGTWLQELSYIGPLRDLPPRNIMPRSTPDKSRWSKGLAAWELLPEANSGIIDEINFWLGEKCLDSGYQLLVKKYRELEDNHPLYNKLGGVELDADELSIIKDLLDELSPKVRVCLREENTQLEVMPQDIGVGISQLFPVVALSVIKNMGLAAIEQPELHIHPRLQVELADVFASAAKKRNVMFLLETHSEHLMLRLLRRVREASDSISSQQSISLTKEDLAVHYVEPTDFGTEFKRLRVTDDGDFLDEWPRGFFDERDEELFF